MGRIDTDSIEKRLADQQGVCRAIIGAECSKDPKDFADRIHQKICEKEMGGGFSDLGISPEEMSMADYKEYVYHRINRIPLNPSRKKDSIAVFISDAGFARMKSDPEYEAWVFEVLRKDFAVYDPWAERCGGSFVIHRFGGEKSEYRGESWRKDLTGGRSRYDKSAEESFWERRRKRKKRIEQIQKKRDKEKWEMEQLDKKNALTRESYRDFLEGKRRVFLSHR